MYQFINIHQRTKTPSRYGCGPRPYQFINIHQRTKTIDWLCNAFHWYQFINIHQRTKTVLTRAPSADRYQFINIHQRTKTKTIISRKPKWYQFINIHQRTKTAKYCGISCGFSHIHTIDYNSIRSPVSRNFSSYSLSPTRRYIVSYCFSVTINARTDPLGGIWVSSFFICFCASS